MDETSFDRDGNFMSRPRVPIPAWIVVWLALCAFPFAIFMSFHANDTTSLFQWISQYIGRSLAYVAGVLCCFLYLLKLKFLYIYGLVELFFASLVLSNFVGSSHAPQLNFEFTSLTSFAAGFLGPIYIGVRGIEDIHKWIREC